MGYHWSTQLINWRAYHWLIVILCKFKLDNSNRMLDSFSPTDPMLTSTVLIFNHIFLIKGELGIISEKNNPIQMDHLKWLSRRSPDGKEVLFALEFKQMLYHLWCKVTSLYIFQSHVYSLWYFQGLCSTDTVHAKGTLLTWQTRITSQGSLLHVMPSETRHMFNRWNRQNFWR